MPNAGKWPPPQKKGEGPEHDEVTKLDIHNENTGWYSAQSMGMPLPLPRHRRLRRWYRLHGAYEGDLLPLLESYDRFVELWNKHEHDPELSLNPEWPEAGIVATLGSGFPENTLLLNEHVTGRFYAIFMGGWEPWDNSTNKFIRNKSNPKRILWAGISEPERFYDYN